MSTQPEALRLADALGNLEATGHCSDSVSLTDRSEAIADAAAAELRRLHAECNDLAHQLKESNERNGRLIAQRDALLKALELAAEALGIAADNRGVKFYQYEEEARAAIKSVEEGK